MTTEPDETDRNEVVDFPPPRDPAERQRAEWRFGGPGPAGTEQTEAEGAAQPAPPRPTLRELTAEYAANAVKNPPPPVKAHDYRDPNERYDELRCRICGREWGIHGETACVGRRPVAPFFGHVQTAKGVGDVEN